MSIFIIKREFAYTRSTHCANMLICDGGSAVEGRRATQFPAGDDLKFVQTPRLRHPQEQLRRIEAARQRHNEERMRLIVDSALDAVAAMDDAGRITEWNAQAEKTFGWSRDQAIGMPLDATIVPARYRKGHNESMRAFLETGTGPILGRRIEISAMHRDGHEFPVEFILAITRGWPKLLNVRSASTLSARSSTVCSCRMAGSRSWKGAGG